MTLTHHTTTNPICTRYPLYDDRWEHDACGTGFLAQVSGEPSHLVVQTALPKKEYWLNAHGTYVGA